MDQTANGANRACGSNWAHGACGKLGELNERGREALIERMANYMCVYIVAYARVTWGAMDGCDGGVVRAWVWGASVGVGRRWRGR